MYSWLVNMTLNYTGPLICRFFFNKYVLQCYTIPSWLNLQMKNCGYRGPTVKLHWDFQLWRVRTANCIYMSVLTVEVSGNSAGHLVLLGSFLKSICISTVW